VQYEVYFTGVANLQAFPSHLTDLLNNTVACIDSASHPKSSNSFYFIINQLLKACLSGPLAFGTKYVESFNIAALKELRKLFFVSVDPTNQMDQRQMKKFPSL
jgi:hypothetical protein